MVEVKKNKIYHSDLWKAAPKYIINIHNKYESHSKQSTLKEQRFITRNTCISCRLIQTHCDIFSALCMILFANICPVFIYSFFFSFELNLPIYV